MYQLTEHCTLLAEVRLAMLRAVMEPTLANRVPGESAHRSLTTARMSSGGGTK